MEFVTVKMKVMSSPTSTTFNGSESCGDFQVKAAELAIMVLHCLSMSSEILYSASQTNGTKILEQQS